jgi:hypothetical protein
MENNIRLTTPGGGYQPLSLKGEKYGKKREIP